MQSIISYFSCSQKTFKAILLVLTAVSLVDGYKVLLLLPFPGPSHFLMFKVFIKELIARGHEVTSISAFAFDEKLSNYTEVLIDPPWPIKEHCELINLKTNRFLQPFLSQPVQNLRHEVQQQPRESVQLLVAGTGLDRTRIAVESS